MDAPICDFAARYINSGTVRLHMPGHKGIVPEYAADPDIVRGTDPGAGHEVYDDAGHEVYAGAGSEPFDITEIAGADELYHPHGIILQSEENASKLFGTARTVYSTEGSSLCIRAMLWLVRAGARKKGRRAVIAAARNAHKTFITAAALLDIDIIWMYSDEPGLVSCMLSGEAIQRTVSENRPDAVYITSPDYLGNIADIRMISDICRRNGCLLLVDNAHGAYLKFAGKELHPIECGADMCCDSAHKTLPVLTGGAYLHISGEAPAFLAEKADNAMSVFASTSPSYLILESLDRMNLMLAEGFDGRIKETIKKIGELKTRLGNCGYRFIGTEPMKITIDANARGFRGDELADILREGGIECEFSDPQYLVLMMTPYNKDSDLERLEHILKDVDQRTEFKAEVPAVEQGEFVMTPAEAMFADSIRIPASDSEGMVLASPEVSCPPAVPAAVCGERIGAGAVRCFEYYGIKEVEVVRQPVR